MNIFKKKVHKIDKENLPRHIGIIMDGNGRWAKKRGMPRALGHRAGANTLKTIATFCDEIGIEALTVYAFSTENWKRPKGEVDNLISLLAEYLSKAEEELGGKNVVIKVIGDLKPFSDDLRRLIFETEELTKNNTGMTLNIALNYGGRAEILSAVKSIIKSGIPADGLEEKHIDEYLYTKGNPPVDLIIRPSGEMRLSNFLLWQCAYAELWYSDVLWPDFTTKHMLEAISDYQKRNRRYGGV
ncbi:MAG: isoprenyl transferase [Eubacteriales bacterium]|jgi:undecaprenyl diphosphate synthase|nr:isoprenyl transferase [Eubacteriales bacterium]